LIEIDAIAYAPNVVINPSAVIPNAKK